MILLLMIAQWLQKKYLDNDWSKYGWKSTFLRQTAVIILLNQIGCYVPADKSTLEFLIKFLQELVLQMIFLLVFQHLWQKWLKHQELLMRLQNPHCYIRWIRRGTSSEDGFAIAFSVLEYIATKLNALHFLLHITKICVIWQKYKQISNKTLKIKEWKDEIIFNYKVIDGIAEGSFGIHVANLAGINKTITTRAKEVLKKNNKVSETKVLSDDLVLEATEDNRHYEISEFIKKLELDNLSPKESLDILYTLKKNYFFEQWT